MGKVKQYHTGAIVNGVEILEIDLKKQLNYKNKTKENA